MTNSLAIPVILKRFENPDETRVFEKGKFELVHLGGMTIGRATYEPGWRWSEHVGKQTGKDAAAHIGYVLSGRLRIRDADGHETAVGPGDAFEIGPRHDAWVLGDEPCVALDFEHLVI